MTSHHLDLETKMNIKSELTSGYPEPEPLRPNPAMNALEILTTCWRLNMNKHGGQMTLESGFMAWEMT